MSPECREFRVRLSAALEPRAAGGIPEGVELTRLAWHEHLMSCERCRALLAAEDALEAVLESLPRPALPPDLAARVLSRLRPARETQALDDAALDQLLELGRVEAPAGLARDVLTALRPRREASARDDALDRLLERVPAPAAPAGLAARVLAGLEDERAPASVRTPPLPPFHWRERSWSPLAPLAAAAALALFGWVAWLRFGGSAVRPADGSPEARAERDAEPSVELLASLELLEAWDLVAEDDPELALAELDELDLLLLELEGS